MGKLANVLKAIGRFINRAIIDMTDDRLGGGMAARQEPDEIPPIDRGQGQDLTGGRAWCPVSASSGVPSSAML